MNKGCLGIGIGVLVLGIIFGLIFVSKYNHMIVLDNEVEKAWANVQTAYQKRTDLVPNLVSTVQGAADYEKETLTSVIAERANATQTKIDPGNLSQADIDRFQQAQSGLGGALSRLLVSVERYPDLKANKNFISLQSELSSIEQEILHERNKFNERATAFNNYTETFPNSLVAGMFNRFNRKGLFQSEPGAENAPDVDFNFGE